MEDEAIPLTPTSGGGLCIDQSALQAADIIVSGGSGFKSMMIKAAQASYVSHASIYDGNGGVIEAVGDDFENGRNLGGVRNIPLALALQDDTLAVAYRHVQLMYPNPAISGKIISFANTQVAEKKSYDTAGAAAAGLARPAGFGLCVELVGVVSCTAARMLLKADERKFYCSELVIAAYQAGGLSITNRDASSSVPEDMIVAYSHGVLRYVGHLLAP